MQKLYGNKKTVCLALNNLPEMKLKIPCSFTIKAQRNFRIFMHLSRSILIINHLIIELLYPFDIANEKMIQMNQSVLIKRAKKHADPPVRIKIFIKNQLRMHAFLYNTFNVGKKRSANDKQSINKLERVSNRY